VGFQGTDLGSVVGVIKWRQVDKIRGERKWISLLEPCEGPDPKKRGYLTAEPGWKELVKGNIEAKDKVVGEAWLLKGGEILSKINCPP